MNVLCDEQAALRPSMALGANSDPDDVNLGVTELAARVRRLPPPADAVQATVAQRKLDAAASTWANLATARTTTHATRSAASEQLRGAVHALVAAGGTRCNALSPHAGG